MDSSHSFLVVDSHRENRYLLVKTLLRKFPGATIYETDDAQQALALGREHPLSAIIVHRTIEKSGADLVRQFRAAHPHLPIVLVSGIDHEEAAMKAGATSFLQYEEWLRIGSVVEAHLAAAAGVSAAHAQPGHAT